MSRAYRIRVLENARRSITASDHVSTHLELLEILPRERMAALLAAELGKRGFHAVGEKLIRQAAEGVIVEVDVKSGAVVARAEKTQQVALEGERQAWSAAAQGPEHENDRESLRKQVHQDLQRQTDEKISGLQKEVTDQLERQLESLRRELDQAVNRVTAEALKEKAARMGRIKDINEDPLTGSLSIVLEV